ncbi:MAG TPA: hypothetical protein VJ476_06055 [Rhizomicrobium sp.]|nr:hypothetical protein [Rhizomicrobium sp.]
MKHIAAAALFALLPFAAQADQRQDLVDGMAKCATVNDGVARLACYDALTPQVKAAQGEAPAAAPAAPPPIADNRPWYDPDRIFGVSPRDQTKPEQFGGENLASPPPAPGQVAAAEPPPSLDSITATVADYSFNPYDKFLVVLDNGQIWQQLESDSGIKAPFHKGEKNTVTISRGFIGSYNLVVNDDSLAYKVRRLK